MKIPFEVDPPKQKNLFDHEDEQTKNKPTSTTANPKDKADTKKIWTVTKLNRFIRIKLESSFRLIYVEGEISSLKKSNQGHYYFDLVDNDSLISCVFFKRDTVRLKFELNEGLKVVLKAHLSVYEVRGQYQLQVISVEPIGMGALALAFEQLKLKLQKLGYFDEDKKLALPAIPSKIGIITSKTGAVIHDMLKIHSQRLPQIPLLLYPAQVQGLGAAKEIIKGINYFNTSDINPEIDVIIIARGGGSAEDLSVFNNEALAKAAFKSKIPIISAIGHQSDFCILDFVSSVRAPTPTAAMQYALPDNEHLKSGFKQTLKEFFINFQQQIATKKLLIERYTLQLKSPDNLLFNQAQVVDEFHFRLINAFKIYFNQQSNDTDYQSQKLKLLSPVSKINALIDTENALLMQLKKAIATNFNAHQELFSKTAQYLSLQNPLNILKKGYSSVSDKNLNTIKKASQLAKGEQIIVRFIDGKIIATVENILP